MQVEGNGGGDHCQGVGVFSDITKRGITQELPPSRDCYGTALYSTVDTLQPIRNTKCDDLYAFLFAVRRFHQGDKQMVYGSSVRIQISITLLQVCGSHTIIGGISYASQPSTLPNGCLREEILLDAVVSCFGRKPRVVSTRRGLLDDISEEVSDFLNKVIFFSCLIYDPLTELPSLEMALKGPTSQEALIILNGCDRFMSPGVSLDSVLAHITNQPFIASLSVLTIGEGDHSYFKFSRKVFDNLQEAFKSTSCNHHRSIQKSGAIIKENDQNIEKFDHHLTTYTFSQNCPNLIFP